MAHTRAPRLRNAFELEQYPMAGYASLPPEFTWRDDGERVVLSLREIPLAHVEPIGSAWVVRTLMHQIDPQAEPPARIAVPSLEHGKAWLTRWAECRRPLIVRTVAQCLIGKPPIWLKAS